MEKEHVPTVDEIIIHEYPKAIQREYGYLLLAVLQELVRARIWREHGGR